jgi:hypothetical protein
MPASGEPSIASPVEKRNIMPKTVLSIKEKEEQEPKLILLTLTQKKTLSMKEAKLKKAEWPWSKLK